MSAKICRSGVNSREHLDSYWLGNSTPCAEFSSLLMKNCPWPVSQVHSVLPASSSSIKNPIAFRKVDLSYESSPKANALCNISSSMVAVSGGPKEYNAGIHFGSFMRFLMITLYTSQYSMIHL